MLQTPTPSHSVETDLFTLEIKQFKNSTQIIMRLMIQSVSTKDFPYTVDLLKKQLPSILLSQCFNDEKIPFSQEVSQTEIGHLFEHILLEYLCLNKISLGKKKATYSGVTNWNWKKDTRGTFHIYINSGSNDVLFFKPSLQQSIELLTKILLSYPISLYPTVPVEQTNNILYK